MNTQNAKLSEKLVATEREEIIAMLTVIDCEKFNADDYKGKRVATLAGLVLDAIDKDEKVFDLLSEKGFKQFSKAKVAPATASTPAPAPAKATAPATTEKPKTVVSATKTDSKIKKVVDMTPQEVLKSLTPKQSETLKLIVKKYDKGANEVFSHNVMPDGKDAWSFGGVVTTLIEKGVLSRTGKGISKKFHIADDFRTLLIKAKVA